MKAIIYFAILLVVIFSGCRKESENNIDYGYNYFPLIVGKERIYQVVDINIDTAMGIYDTSRYLLKEKVAETFIDNSGNKSCTIERYVMYDSMPSWEVKDVWVAQINSNQAQQVEENLRIVKIVFPLIKHDSWNGNAYNILDPKYYEVESFDKPELLNEKNYDSVLTVVEENNESMINKYYEYEQYAKDIGLINKTVIAINKVTYIDIYEPIVPIEERISIGHLYYQTLISNN
ncbi:MAG: hypothetical protein HY951_10825 [Bacteroidia bacterium]|nr:hypothetical protein [Bacteroidia bacterium]